MFRTALVTGASSGLGRELSRSLARRGTRVVLAARGAERLASLADEITAAGGRADVQVLDVTDTDAVDAAVKRWEAETGGLELVVANAGIGAARPAPELTRADVESVLAVNLTGAAATLLAALPGMLARGHGTLVGMSSLAAYRGLPGAGSYCASKAGLSTLLETLRADLDGTGVRVVDVRPGYVRTPMTAGLSPRMPFVLDLDEAVPRLVRGIERGGPLVTLPAAPALLMRLVGVLPGPLYRGLLRLALRRG
jgi:NAD(P)-dependent dehydrogenase (short-subunit alcohol dehydrogenase family)